MHNDASPIFFTEHQHFNSTPQKFNFIVVYIKESNNIWFKLEQNLKEWAKSGNNEAFFVIMTWQIFDPTNTTGQKPSNF